MHPYSQPRRSHRADVIPATVATRPIPLHLGLSGDPAAATQYNLIKCPFQLRVRNMDFSLELAQHLQQELDWTSVYTSERGLHWVGRKVSLDSIMDYQ